MTIRRVLSTVTLLAIGAGSLLASTSASLHPPAPSPAPGEPSLAEVRKATERFRSVDVALANGYIRDPFDVCETAEMMGRPAADGAMGIHYFRPDLLGIAEMIESGVTTVADHYFEMHLIAEAVEESGLRAHLAPTMFGVDPHAELAAAAAFAERWHGAAGGRIQAWLGPHAP